MKLRRAILQVMRRDGLKAVVDELGIDGVDRRSAKEMSARLSRSRVATPELLLGVLGEQDVKAVCELVGLDSTGRRKALVERLLRHDRSSPASGRKGTRRRGRRRAKAGSGEEDAEMKPNPNETKSTDRSEQQPVRLPDPPPGVIRVSKTELVWPGKYNEDGTLREVPRVTLPFQVIETINESRASREAKKGIGATLFDIYQADEGESFEDGWRNKLIWGDNLLVMGSLLEKFAGKIDLIYIDPPFATGADFSFTTPIGESGEEVYKKQSVIEEKAYRDTWGRGLESYLQVMHERLRLIRDLLSPTGSLLVHIDYRVTSHLRLLLDEIFGPDGMRNELVWNKGFRGTRGQRIFQHAHDTIWWFTTGDNYLWAQTFEPYKDKEMSRYNKVDEEGKRYALIKRHRTDGAVYYGKTYPGEEGKWRNDVISNVPTMAATSSERVGFDTQKPEGLLSTLVSALSKDNSIVADVFCGSGTTLAVAEKLGRRWIGCDLGRWAIHVTRKRLLGIENCKPFEVLNLGKYERQYWQGVTFGEAKEKPLTERALYEYLAFILKLYGAQPVAGLEHIHGKTGRALVHIGAVDAPVTISEIDAAIDECAKLKQLELHVLGWEWEMGLYDLMVEQAKKKGVKLVLLIIPREVMEEQAAAKGDVRFFELAYLEAKIDQSKKLTSQVALKDFVIPNTELIPEDVRSKVKKWSDYIDYWAIDWDFQNDTFMQGWVAYRTRKERKLPLTSDPHTYEKPGKYRILVKVVDIFGNDTSQAFDVEVR